MVFEVYQRDINVPSEQLPRAQGCTDTLDFQIVDTLSEFDALRPEWEALTQASNNPGLVFQQHTWIWHWWNTFLDEKLEPAIVTGRRKGQLVLGMALAVETNLGVRTLTWMGTPVSQYSDVVCKEEDVTSSDIVRGLRYAADICGGDLLIASKVREDTVLAVALVAQDSRVTDEQVAPALRIHNLTSPQDIEAKFSSKMRRNRRRKRKLLEQSGDISFRMVSEGAVARSAVERALAFKADWLEKHAIVSNAYAEPRFAEFWGSVATSADRPVGLTASILKLDRRPVAIEIGLRYKGVHCAHIGAFDIELERASPGAAQMDAVFEACIQHGVHTYDMLAPNADYKQRLADDFVTVRDYVLALSAKGKACDALRLTESRGVAKAAVRGLPPSVRKVIKSTLGV